MNALDFTLIASLVALGVTIFCAFLLAFVYNRASRNLALASGALVGATVFFCTQLYFELRPSSAFDFITTELTIDRSKPEIRQWVYTPSVGDRIGAEVNASEWLAAHNPDIFRQDRDKLTTDLVLFSIAGFLQDPEAQFWETRKHSIVGGHAGGIIRFHPYPGRACRLVSETELRSELYRSGNVFAGAPLSNRSICLPPSSVLEVLSQSLVIRNPICEVVFRLDPSRGVTYLNPGRGEGLPKLQDGESRFETRAIGLDVETTFFGLRAQSREGTKYREWASAVVNGVRDWFEK